MEPKTEEMPIAQRVAWLHRSAISLKTNDLVELKFSLKSLISQATETLEHCRNEILAQRKMRGENGQ